MLFDVPLDVLGSQMLGAGNPQAVIISLEKIKKTPLAGSVHH